MPVAASGVGIGEDSKRRVMQIEDITGMVRQVRTACKPYYMSSRVR